MGWILLILGFILGLFLWASLIGILFLYLPMVVRFRNNNIIDKVFIHLIILPIIVAGVILLTGYIFSINFAWGASIGAVAMFVNFNNLKKENWVKVLKDYDLTYVKYHNRESMLKNGFSERDYRLKIAIEDDENKKIEQKRKN
jgi:hypothetical protein